MKLVPVRTDTYVQVPIRAFLLKVVSKVLSLFELLVINAQGPAALDSALPFLGFSS